MRNLPTCDAVADFFLLQIDINAGDSITNLKLQKLCYYAQAWSLALRDRPMFDEDIEAWPHGPVLPELYRRFKKYGFQGIDPHDLKTEPLRVLSDDDQDLLIDVWNRYGQFSGRQLEKLTHQERPWREARGEAPPGARSVEALDHEIMKSFYRNKLRDHGENTRAKPPA